ncbi:MAG TPA: helix-turn-helix transcriptional regulator [Longimicrobium sp.]|jgi:transcriptional regulator with XRE-family HTH domain|uniref:helix-turn-helix domain-containing protein n=1 Tax=Longimicrobium sp. TaxID=2029185 RepID=UPI002EDB9A0B
MDDLDRYIALRASRDPEFLNGFERERRAFKFGLMLKQARLNAGLTQHQVAERLGTNKSAISRMENRAEDIRLSTLQRYAEAVGCILALELRPESEGWIPRVQAELAAGQQRTPEHAATGD